MLNVCLQMTDHSFCRQIFAMIGILTKISTKLQMLSYRNAMISPNHLAHILMASLKTPYATLVEVSTIRGGANS